MIATSRPFWLEASFGLGVSARTRRMPAILVGVYLGAETYWTVWSLNTEVRCGVIQRIFFCASTLGGEAASPAATRFFVA